MPKKRKCTYSVRREKAKSLHAEVLILESDLEVLQSRSRSVDEASTTGSILQKAHEKNATLLAIGRRMQFEIAEAQSIASRLMDTQQSYPLYTHIRLGKDWNQRQEKLTTFREKKLLKAYNFVTAPMRIGASKFSDERFETEEGDICCVRYETTEFPGVQSVQQVFDAVMFYFANTEISITERLGHVTVRDDYDCVEGTISNSRIISRNDQGITVEASTLMFSQMFNDGNRSFGGGPCGVIVIDCVDEDELYPYVPSERVRRDGSGAIVVTVNKSKSQSKKAKVPAEELVVTLRRAAFIKLHHPRFPVSAGELEGLHDGIARWGDVMLKAVRSILYTT